MNKSHMKTTVAFLMMFVSAVGSAQQEPTTGYAPVNGLRMYYEIHGTGDPVVLLHGSFMTISNNWTEWIGELSKTRKVIAIEMQGHGRTADIKRDFSYENLADDVAALLDYLGSPSADLIGYSMGGGVAMQCAIRHPSKVRKVVSISAVFRHDGWVEEALDMFPQLTAEALKGSPIETEYMKLSPTPNEFPNFVKRVIAMDLKPYDFGADKLKATEAPMLFIHGDADGVRLEHISEMFRLKGDEIFGDMRPRSASRLAILPNTTHITLMERMPVIVPIVNDFFDGATQGAPPPLAPVEHVYAQPGGTQLKAYVFSLEKRGGERRPAIVLFHGGGWTMGEPAWAFSRAQQFAQRGMVAVAAQYRLSDQKEITPHEAMADARAVIRWVRAHADSLGIDPKRVAAYGWSAGAHLAAAAAIFGNGAPGDSDTASPDALVLVSPALSLVEDGWVRRILIGRGSARDISPDEHVRKGLPPALILQGDVDTVTPVTGARRFCERMRAAGNVCELHVYEGFGHLFTPAGTPDAGWPQPDPATSADASRRADRFLESLGFLAAEPAR